MSATLDPKAAPSRVTAWLSDLRPAIDGAIERALPTVDDDPGRLIEAMRYAVLGPGKRLRPALTMAACEACGGALDDAMAAAVAVEMLHAYTLVHDDLPAMDDDDERRGRPTVHIAYSEAIAVLAGDGLLTAAFESLATMPRGVAEAVAVLAARSGRAQLLAGQARDLALGEASPTSLNTLERVHTGKTGALFAAATELGAISAGADQHRAAMAELGMALGVGFQYADDFDDGEFAELAAPARARRTELAERARTIAESFGERGSTLVEVARWFGHS